MNMLKIKADAKGLTLSFAVDEDLPRQIISDSNRLRQILINLIGNAIKFTSLGGITVTARPELVDDAHLLAFEIEDTGVGLTAEQAARLFQPFTQADSSTSRVFGGTGLGLDISQRVAAALGGTVKIVRSAPKQGTTFLATVRLETPAKETRISAPVAASAPSAELGALKVLLVDDNQDNQILISRILKRRGAMVTTAVNGRLGVSSAQSNSFDVILMDIQMPVMNGYEAIAELRLLGNPTPIVALTANAFKEERDACFANGCDAYLTKPVDVAELVSTLQKYRIAAPVI